MALTNTTTATLAQSSSTTSSSLLTSFTAIAFENYTCEDFDNPSIPCPCPSSDADIAGIGVFIALLVTTTTTALLSAAGIVLRRAKTSTSILDQAIFAVLATFGLGRRYGPATLRQFQRQRITIGTIRATLLGLSDQALWLGVALLVIQNVGLALHNISDHNWTLVSDLCSLLSLTQIFSMSMLSEDLVGTAGYAADERLYDNILHEALRWKNHKFAGFIEHKNKTTKAIRQFITERKEADSKRTGLLAWIRIIRAIMLSIMFMLLLASSIMGPGSYWFNDGCPALCRVQDQPGGGFFKDPVTVILTCYTYPPYILALIRAGYSFSAYRMVVQAHLESLIHTRTVRPALKILIQLSAVWLLIWTMVIGLATLNTYWIIVWIITSSVYAQTGTFIVYYIVTMINAVWNRQPSSDSSWPLSCPVDSANQWSNGQILPVMLLLVPFFSATQEYNDQVRDTEDIHEDDVSDEDTEHEGDSDNEDIELHQLNVNNALDGMADAPDIIHQHPSPPVSPLPNGEPDAEGSTTALETIRSTSPLSFLTIANSEPAREGSRENLLENPNVALDGRANTWPDKPGHRQKSWFAPRRRESTLGKNP